MAGYYPSMKEQENPQVFLDRLQRMSPTTDVILYDFWVNWAKEKIAEREVK